MPKFPPLAAAMMVVWAAAAPQPLRAADGLAGPFLAAKVAAASADFVAADIWYQRALASAPRDIGLLNGAMIAALSLGEIGRAADLAGQLQGMGAANQNTLLAQMAGAALQGDFAEIIEIQTLELSSGSLQDDLLAGWALIGLGQMNDGVSRFDKLAQVQGLAGIGLYHKAIALALAGNFDGAAAALGAPEAGAMRASRRGALLFAEILSQIGKGGEAAALLRGGFALGGDSTIADKIAQLEAGAALPISGFVDARSGLAEAFFTVASALSEGDETDPAYTLLQARIAAALRPADAEAQVLTAQVLERLGQYDLAAQTYGKVSPSAPEFLFAEMGRADAVFSAGRGAESLQILRDLAARFPQSYDAQLALGNGLRRAEDFPAAVAAYDAALALLPDLRPAAWPIFYSRAIALERMGAFDRAEADFRRALDLSPNQANVLNYLGYSLVDRGLKLDEALAMIQAAVALRPDSGYIVDSLAWAYFRLGRFAEALAPMERAAQLEPVDPIVTDHLGDVYWANGRKREAMFQWRRALSYEPAENDAARIRLKLELGLDEVRAREGDPPFPDLNRGGL